MLQDAREGACRASTLHPRPFVFGTRAAVGWRGARRRGNGESREMGSVERRGEPPAERERGAGVEETE